MEKTRPIDLSRQNTQLLIEFRNLLRGYGVKISLTDRDAALKLVNASAQIEDDDVQELRRRLVGFLPEVQSCYVSGESDATVICEECGNMLGPVDLKQPECYIACSCGKVILLIPGTPPAESWHAVQFCGLYRFEGGDNRLGEMVVEELSYDGARIRNLTPHVISQDDRLVISFTLDDHSQTIVHKTVWVTNVKGEMVIVRFEDASSLDHNLAVYLGINWIKT